MFVEPHPQWITPNPGGAADPLGESVQDPTQPWLRIFEPASPCAVIGRGQDPERELQCAQLRADSVPMYRRICGGGSVVLAPGMVVVALRLPRGELFPDAWLNRIGDVLAGGLTSGLRLATQVRGHGDLAVATGDGERKILGASLRLTGTWCLYLGVVLVADAVPLMERYLAHPSREPGYRQNRRHGDFCTHLGRWGATVEQASLHLERACRAEWSDV